MEQLSYLYGRKYLLCYVIAFCIMYAIFNLWYSIKRQQFVITSNMFEVLTVTSSAPEIIHWDTLQTNLSCHYSLQDDALESVDKPGFLTGDNAIFFHETSCRGGINSRQACAIESAARLHQNWQVILLFSSPVSEHILRSSNLVKLLQYHNVKVARLLIEQYGQGTVVEDILKNKLKKSSHPMEHTSDILRILTLHKYGGVYLDTDSILVRNLTALPPNWIGKESNDQVASGAMAFSKEGFGSIVTTAVLTELRDTFDPTSWSYNGPLAINRVLQRLCPNSVRTSTDCQGLKIFNPGVFYPVHYSYRDRYFKNGTIQNMDQPYMHHMWNYLTKNMTIESDSPYAKLARRFCPTIYEMYGKEFGQ